MLACFIQRISTFQTATGDFQIFKQHIHCLNASKLWSLLKLSNDWILTSIGTHAVKSLYRLVHKGGVIHYQKHDFSLNIDILLHNRASKWIYSIRYDAYLHYLFWMPRKHMYLRPQNNRRSRPPMRALGAVRLQFRSRLVHKGGVINYQKSEFPCKSIFYYTTGPQNEYIPLDMILIYIFLGCPGNICTKDEKTADQVGRLRRPTSSVVSRSWIQMFPGHPK